MSSSQPTCDFCNLPLPKGLWNKSTDPEQAAQYCCLGCSFAAAVTREKGEEGATRWRLTSLGLSIFFTMNVMVFTLVLWQNDIYETETVDPFLKTLSDLFRYLCLLFSLPVLFLLGRPLLENAIVSLRRGILSTDLLLITGVIAAYVYSAISVFSESGAIYFEVGCMILVMVTLGRWLEATGRLRATNTLDELEKLLPETVHLVNNQQDKYISIDDVNVGDILRVLPGERVPVDGQLLVNSATLDEQILTGESWPVEKQPGEILLGGTLNLNQLATLRVTATSNSGTLARMIESVRLARLSKGKYERLTDTVARWFFPAVACIVLATFGYHTWAVGFEQGMLSAIAVVLIACPCALGLATPMAIWAALGRAAEAQVLFRNGEALEQLATVQAIRFDKTGTLTTGEATVTQFVCDSAEQHEVLQQAATLAKSSAHLFSLAIGQYAESVWQTADVPADQGREQIIQSQNIPGRGIVAKSNTLQCPIWLGSLQLMQENKLTIPKPLQQSIDKAYAQGLPVTFIGWQGRVRGLFVFTEQLRPQSQAVMQWCRDAGIDVAVLTGDHSQRGARLAEELHVPVVAELLPDQKVIEISRARQTFGSVAMVGDGMNDAPALMAADIGMAMGCGADLSRDSASVCLLGNQLNRIPWSIQLARLTVQTIKRNLCWAFGYNSLGILLAATGYLNPAFAALLMIVSSLFVVTSSLRLKYVTIPEATSSAENRNNKREFPGELSALKTEDAMPLTQQPVQVNS